MSSQPRRSSVVPRGSQRPHVPFHADDLARGKKTGMSIRAIARNSDDFEPFDKVLTQADSRTPPLLKSRKRIRRDPSVPDEEPDEDGEISMDVDDSGNSPAGYLSTAPRPRAPSSLRRSSSRIPADDSIDFDRLPSPRRSPLSSRTNGAQHTSSRRSKLSFVQYSDQDMNGDTVGTDDMDIVQDDDYPSEPEPAAESPPRERSRSFSEMNQDDDEPSSPPKAPTPPRPASEKRRKKIRSPSLSRIEETVEEEIAQGLDNLGDQEEEEEPRPRPITKSPKRSRAKEQPKNIPNKRSRVQKTVLPLSESNQNTDGLRRSSRYKFAPLEWWRLEKAVIGRDPMQKSFVPVIKEIIRYPKEEIKPLGKKKTSSRRTKHTAAPIAVVDNPEEGWDDNTESYGVVVDYVTQAPVERRIAFTAKMLTPKAAANSDFFFQKIFGDGDFIAAGELVIPPGKRKPPKSTKDNTYVFYVIEGAVNVRVHNNNYILATGAKFMIPRGNRYYIENICERDTRLFFAQARKIATGEEEYDASVANSSPQRRASGSRGAQSPGASTHS